ncbi:MAG: RHS repeat-associated core domain-containing protein [Candidatus Acidiferrales bacterium]|jgi:RHS repeat-associated protein
MTAAGVNYLYDGDGRRVTKLNGSGQPTKVYWYGSGGSILAETGGDGSTSAEYIFFGGQRIAMLPAGGSAQYYVEDMLGSSRIVATNTGVVCYDADFYPFGGERSVTDNCPQANKYKFEGKERDNETQNDDFGARYYSWRFGRWLSADWSAVPEPVPYANLTNPQTLNLYAMVHDDPESFADLDGHQDIDVWDVLNFAAGALNAWTSDNSFGVGRGDPQTTAGQAGAAVGDTVATIQGAEEMTAGGALFTGGTALDATGGGAVIGVPAQVVGVAVTAHGATVTAVGGGHLLASAVKAVSKSDTGPKAKDAPGVTAGGQATDEHGNKLGPSGDKQINKTKNNTREAAKNRARNEGSGTTEHRNPRRGNPHFHPTDNKGRQKPSSTHHEYPD